MLTNSKFLQSTFRPQRRRFSRIGFDHFRFLIVALLINARSTKLSHLANAYPQGEFVVVWERPISATEADIWGARVGAAGSVVSGPFPVDVSASTLSARPRVAVDPTTGSYLVAYEDEPVGGAGRTVRWSLFDSADQLVTTQAFTIAGYLTDVRPDVGFVRGVAGTSGFVLAHRRNSTTTPNSTVQVTWIDATTGAAIDSQAVPALATPRDGLPAVPQLADNGATLVAFQRFDTTTLDLDVLASCVTLAGGVAGLAAPLNVSADPGGADGAPDVSVVGGNFQVVWERVVAAASDRNIRGREVLAACAGFGGLAIDVTSLSLLELTPAVVTGLYNGPCSGQSLVVLAATAAPAGSFPYSLLGRRWASGTGALGALETLVQGQVGVSSFSTPRAALDSSSTSVPRFLLVYDDNGSGANPAAEVLAQFVTFDEIPLSVVVTPASVTACGGSPVTLDATVTGSGAWAYQWRRNAAPIPGATSPSYAIPAVAGGDAGSYDVVVTGACGTLLSNAVSVQVSEPITGVTIAVSASPACVGSAVSFTATTAGGTATSYGWFRNGAFLTVTPTSTLVLPAVQVANAGDYTVTANNVCGPVTSAVAATLQVEEAISGVTIAASTGAACAGTDVTLTATPSGGAPTSYGWFRDGAFLTVTPTNTLVLTAVQPGDSGDYSVTADNACGPVSSAAPASVQVSEPITGVTIAVSASPACVGSAVSFTATTAGGTATSYGWFRNGAFLTVTPTNTLVLPAVQVANAGDYTVTVEQFAGPSGQEPVGLGLQFARGRLVGGEEARSRYRR